MALMDELNVVAQFFCKVPRYITLLIRCVMTVISKLLTKIKKLKNLKVRRKIKQSVVTLITKQ